MVPLGSIRRRLHLSEKPFASLSFPTSLVLVVLVVGLLVVVVEVRHETLHWGLNGMMVSSSRRAWYNSVLSYRTTTHQLRPPSSAGWRLEPAWRAHTCSRYYYLLSIRRMYVVDASCTAVVVAAAGQAGRDPLGVHAVPLIC